MKASSPSLSGTDTDVGGDQRTLAPEVSHFLVQLSIALHRSVTYPRSHPTLDAAISALTLRLHRLLAERPIVSLGVAHDSLLVDGTLTDPRNEVLRGLAESLHRHQVGAIRFHRGVSSSEVSGLLAGLAADARQVGPFGIQDSEARSRWPAIQVEPAAFDDLELEECSAKVARAERAWLMLAAAALMRDPDYEGLENVEAPELADAIRVRLGDAAYGSTIARYMAQVGHELADLRGACPHVIQQMGNLVSAMGPDTLEILLEVGSDQESRNRMVRDLTGVLPAGSAIALTRAASVASTEGISHALLRLFTKMALNAESRTGTTSAAADAALRDSIRHIVDGWTLSDPNPGPYRDVLRYLTRVGRAGGEPEQADPSTDALRLVELSIETGAVGEMVWRAMDELLEAGRLEEILDRLEKTPDVRPEEPLRRYLVQPDRLKIVLEGQHSRQAIDRLLQLTGEEAADVLLDSLGTADSRATRRQIIARLQEMGDAIVDRVLGRLEQGPWYVQRNMLYLISQMERMPARLEIGPWLAHGDARVRHEAIRVALHTELRGRAIEVGLKDSDSRILSLVLSTAAEGCPPEIVPGIIRLLDESRLETSLRVLAVRVLGQSESVKARACLVRIASTRRRFWRRRTLRPKSADLLAALAALSTWWQSDPEATAILRLAMRSTDPDIHSAVQSTVHAGRVAA